MTAGWKGSGAGDRMAPSTDFSKKLFAVPLSRLLFKEPVLPLPEVFQDSARHFHQALWNPLPNMQFLFSGKLPFLILLFVFKYYDLEF